MKLIQITRKITGKNDIHKYSNKSLCRLSVGSLTSFIVYKNKLEYSLYFIDHDKTISKIRW